MKYKEIPAPNLPMDSERLRAFITDNDITILFSIDNTPKWGKLRHCSIAHPDRDPTWAEIREIKENLFGDTSVMMMLPRKEVYVNEHQHCFHLWSTPEDWDLM